MAPAIPRILLSSSMQRRAEVEPDLFVLQLLKPMRQQALRAGIARVLAASRERTLAPAAKTERPAELLAERLPLRILVVDDIEVNRRVALALLRRLGYEADSAGSGRAAIDAATAQRYDLVLLDVQMPDIDGPEVALQLRQQLGPDAPRMIAVTAHALEGDRERYLATGMDDYVSKPIDFRMLRAAIERSPHPNPAAATPSAPTAPPDRAPLIDWRRLDVIAPHGDASLVETLIGLFSTDARKQAAALESAGLTGNGEAMAAAAHALRGAASNIGAAAVESLAREVESLVRSGKIVEAAVQAQGIEGCLARTIEAFANRPAT